MIFSLFRFSRRASKGGALSWLIVLCTALAIAGCESPRQRTIELPGRAEPPPIAVQPPPGTPVDPGTYFDPPHMEGREPVRIALLLPFGAPEKNARDIAQGMFDAAQLALFDVGNPDLLLIPKDTAGRADIAAQAADEAIRDGAELILGPLFAPSVAAVAPRARARNVPVIAFSSDRSVAGDGVHLLSFLPDQDVERIVDFAVQQNILVFAAMIPEGDYGARVSAAFRRSVQERGADIFAIETYPPVAELMFDPARRLALYDERQYQLKVGSDAEGLGEGDASATANPDELPDVPYDAVFLPDGGTQLKSVAPLLPYFDVDPRKVRFLGTGLWDDAALGREPSLVGGWFAAPAPEAQGAFAARFQRSFGMAPPRIASLAYDAMALTATLASTPNEDRFSDRALTNPDGFAGVDGIFRFLPDGTNERGLAVMEMRPTGPKVIDPAPASFAVPRTF